jgi:hypothetical protein
VPAITDAEAEQRTQCIGIDIRLAEAEWPRRRQIRHHWH